MRPAILALLITGAASPAVADVTVSFMDGAPKDRFAITSDMGLCAESAARITIDLKPTAGQLIFDIEAGGAGVQVFQPFELVEGRDIVTGTSGVSDGDTALSVAVSEIIPGSEVAFTIDVDDTIGAQEITVAGSEIAGGVVIVAADGDRAIGTFDADGIARVAWPACLS